jgi:uncharacterized protein YhdP
MQAAQALGVPVRIGAISARSEGLIPSFELQDVVLLDPQGREALRLPLVVAALSPRSLWNLGFEQLYIDGRAWTFGAPPTAASSSPASISRAAATTRPRADWFFSQANS